MVHDAARRGVKAKNSALHRSKSAASAGVAECGRFVSSREPSDRALRTHAGARSTELFRNNQFLEAAAETAKRKNFPVQLTGSNPWVTHITLWSDDQGLLFWRWMDNAREHGSGRFFVSWSAMKYRRESLSRAKR